MPKAKEIIRRVIVGGNGLTTEHERELQAQLDAIQPVLERRGMFGQKENEKLFDLQRRLRARINPEDPTELAKEAGEFIAWASAHVESVRARTEKFQAEHDAYTQECKARREAVSEEIRRRIEAEEEKRLARIAAREQLG
jgi:hypothetical protein